MPEDPVLPTREASAEPSTAPTMVAPEVHPDAGMTKSRHSSPPDDVGSACSMGEAGKTVAASIDSTCAGSTLSGGTSSNTPFMPLLKASPPTPVGRLAGRFKVRLWRASTAQPFGVSFGSGNKTGTIIVEDAMPHIGLRKGDEVISINGQPVTCVRQGSQALETSSSLELLLFHRELPDDSTEKPPRPLCGVCLEPGDFPACCEPCFLPPESRCRASSFPLRDVLLTTGPVPSDACGSFSMQILRISRMQPFGLVIAATPRASQNSRNEIPVDARESTDVPSVSSAGAGLDSSGTGASASRLVSGLGGTSPTSDEADEEIIGGPSGKTELEPVFMCIKENLPHLGLMEGDELLQINGAAANSVEACKVALRTATTLALELRRPGQIGFVKRLEEPSAVSASSVKDAQESTGNDWFSRMWRRITTQACCFQTASPSDDQTGLDRTHDIHLSRAKLSTHPV